MFQSAQVHWNNEAYLASGTCEGFTEFVLCPYIIKIHLWNDCMGINIQFYYSPYRITNIKSNNLNNGSIKYLSVRNDFANLSNSKVRMIILFCANCIIIILFMFVKRSNNKVVILEVNLKQGQGFPINLLEIYGQQDVCCINKIHTCFTMKT